VILHLWMTLKRNQVIHQRVLMAVCDGVQAVWLLAVV
jgi:hypothetical protein